MRARTGRASVTAARPAGPAGPCSSAISFGGLAARSWRTVTSAAAGQAQHPPVAPCVEAVHLVVRPAPQRPHHVIQAER